MLCKKTIDNCRLFCYNKRKDRQNSCFLIDNFERRNFFYEPTQTKPRGKLCRHSVCLRGCYDRRNNDLSGTLLGLVALLTACRYCGNRSDVCFQLDLQKRIGLRSLLECATTRDFGGVCLWEGIDCAWSSFAFGRVLLGNSTDCQLGVYFCQSQSSGLEIYHAK